MSPLRRFIAAASPCVLLLAAWCGVLSAATTAPKDPYKDLYAGYKPDFLEPIWRGQVFGRWRAAEKQMRLSSESSFYTLNQIHEDSRANALVKAALAKEWLSKHREALKMYQIVIDRYPHQLYRVSKYGVFVPVAQYCQRRILDFPGDPLEHYRTLHDARAREAFQQALRTNSLIGLSEIVDSMLASSYGGKAMAELGNASLDTGHYLAALERFSTIRDFFPDAALQTPELALKIAYCHKMLGTTPPAPKDHPGPAPKSGLTKLHLDRLREILKTARSDRPPFHSQITSPPHSAADDYTLMPPTTDPMALTPPTWARRLPGTRRARYVYSQPVVTRDSVIYRHKNIVYCHSILNGELRWVNDLGGRATWQNGPERQYPREDVLVQDGLVFTVMAKGGPSLVALDQVSGQLKWAYGPMVASTVEESRMRFETAPAGGPRTVYAGYVLDNIEGETHTDTEYGVIAFESTTGRIRWRRALCRLAPGKFAAGFAVQRRNRIRSFTSAPLCHQGTVYYCTNAGAIAAVDSLSGRVKWLMRYQYYPTIHDATRPHTDRRRLWYNQRPLVVGERLYIPPVDSPFFLCLDRRTGKVNWSFAKPGVLWAYFLGPMSTGELVFVYSGRGVPYRMHTTSAGSTPAVHVLDPKTGKTVWRFKDLMPQIDTPVLRHYIFGSPAWCNINRAWTYTAARPCLTQGDKLSVTAFADHSVYYRPGMITYNLTELDLRTRKMTGYRRYYTGELLAHCDWVMHSDHQRCAPADLKAHQELPHKDDRVKHRIKVMQEMINGESPSNQHGPFMPFVRVTVRRYGVPFELRFGPRQIMMVYDRAAVEKALANRRDTAADFARAELAIARSRFGKAATLLKQCLRTISSEDLDFRALINQQLYKVHKRLCRSTIRAGNLDVELENALGMARTAGTLADEVETLFALSEAYERRGDPAAAARCLRSIISTYGHHEYPVSAAAVSDPEGSLAAARSVLDQARRYAANPFYGEAFGRGLLLTGKGLPVYLSAVSPLPKDLTVRAGELAASRLMRLLKSSPEFAATLEKVAARELLDRTPEEQLYRLREFPGGATSQRVLAGLFDQATRDQTAAARRQLWRLADAARVSGLTVPESVRPRVSAPPRTPHFKSIALPAKDRPVSLAGAEGINWLVLERRGRRERLPHLLFLGGRVRKRLDNKFVLDAFDLSTGELVWKQENIRLKGRGQEPGFFQAFVYDDILVVHGLYDVLALDAKTGRWRWRYRAPFDFEIKNAVMSGGLLILAGKTETLALYVPTDSPAGEVAWQVKEMGDLYIPPYFHQNRLVSVRKMPFNVTVRYRATGKLIGRLDLPDLSLFEKHPLLEKGPEALPVAVDGRRLVVSDGWYYIMVDVEEMSILWKRLIDQNDLSREPAMRFALNGDYLAVLKEDYDQKAIYMLSSKTGRVLWHTDPKDGKSPQPIHSMLIHGDTIYGIGVHPGQRFYFVARDCKTGALKFSRGVKGYDARPSVSLLPRLYGGHAVVTVQDRQVFELRGFDAKTGEPVHMIRKKGVGPLGVHGRASVTVQNGRLVMLSKDKLSL